MPPFNNDTARLRTLSSLGLLDALPDDAFDALTRFAVRALGVDQCAVSVVDGDRVHFLSRQGFHTASAEREGSLCSHTLQSRGLLCIPDCELDPLFEGRRRLVGKPGMRFYAGQALRAPDGQAVGVFWVSGLVPRELSTAELDLFDRLVADAEARIAACHAGMSDPVTGLSSHQGFRQRAARSLVRCRQEGAKACFTLLILMAPPQRLPRNLEDTLVGDFAALMVDCFPPDSVLAYRGRFGFLALTPAATVSDLRDCLDQLLIRFRRSTLGTEHAALSWLAGSVDLLPGAIEEPAVALASAEQRFFIDKWLMRTYGAGG